MHVKRAFTAASAGNGLVSPYPLYIKSLPIGGLFLVLKSLMAYFASKSEIEFILT